MLGRQRTTILTTSELNTEDDGSTLHPASMEQSWCGHHATISHTHHPALRSRDTGPRQDDNRRKSRTILEILIWQAFSNRSGVVGWLYIIIDGSGWKGNNDSRRSGKLLEMIQIVILLQR